MNDNINNDFIDNMVSKVENEILMLSTDDNCYDRIKIVVAIRRDRS